MVDDFWNLLLWFMLLEKNVLIVLRSEKLGFMWQLLECVPEKKIEPMIGWYL